MNELKRHWKLGVVLLLILSLRLISLGWLALSDPTESRYADIALRMMEHHQWVTPDIIIHGQEIPYWGKPPLHFWMTALSFRVFGISEWSARLPSYLSGLAMTFFTFLLAYRLRGVRTALIACITLTSSGLFFVLAGESSIDVTLSATIAGAMTAFAMVVLTKKKSWGLLFVVFLAAGMLTKGPVAILLVLFAIGIWLAISRRWSALKDLPWKTGTILFLIISAPWYVLAEMRTPGFLRYFFLNENLLRFLIHDYGDKYGSGHVYPRGASWIMLLLTFLPWTGALLFVLWKNLKERFVDEWQVYLFSWGLVPAIVFMFPKQILATYLLPGFAGLAIAISLVLTESRALESTRVILKSQILFVLALLSAAILAAFWYHVGLFWPAAGLLIFGFSFLIRRLFFRESMNADISLAALGCALMITICTITFGEKVDDRVSAKNVMHSILTNPSYSGHAVVFPFGIPYSALFYEQAFTHQNKLLLHQNDWNHLEDADQDIFIFSSQQWETLGSTARNRLLPIYTSSHWVACRKDESKGKLSSHFPGCQCLARRGVLASRE